MLFTKAQRIVLFSGVGVAAALLVGLFFLPKPNRADAAAPSPSPTVSASPTVRPTHTIAPTPTVRPTATPAYRLPLVPLDATEAPTPSAVPTTAPTMTPPTAPTDAPTARFDSEVRDFLAIGLRDGEPVAILVARLAPPNLSVAAIPCEALSVTADAANNGTAKELERSIADRFGLELNRSFTADLSCMDKVLEAVPTMTAAGMTFDESTVDAVLGATGSERAYGMGALGAGLCACFREITPWTFAAVRDATRGKVQTELSLWELLGFCAALQGMETSTVVVLPTEQDGTVLAQSADSVLRTVFR